MSLKDKFEVGDIVKICPPNVYNKRTKEMLNEVELEILTLRNYNAELKVLNKDFSMYAQKYRVGQKMIWGLRDLVFKRKKEPKTFSVGSEWIIDGRKFVLELVDEKDRIVGLRQVGEDTVFSRIKVNNLKKISYEEMKVISNGKISHWIK